MIDNGVWFWGSLLRSACPFLQSGQSGFSASGVSWIAFWNSFKRGQMERRMPRGGQMERQMPRGGQMKRLISKGEQMEKTMFKEK